MDQDRIKPQEEQETSPRKGLWTTIGNLGRKTREQSEALDNTTPSLESVRVPQVGRLLQEARQARRMTLDEAETATRIRSRYLAALETGEYDQLPTPGHVHGFLRNYAIYLGLDWEEVESLYRKERPTRHFDPGIFHPQNIALLPRRSLLRAELVLVLVIVLVIAVVGGGAFWIYGRPIFYPSPTLTFTPTARPVTATPQAAVIKASTATRGAFTPTPTETQPVLRTVTPTTPPTPTPTATATLNAPLVIATPTPLPTATPTSTPTRTQGVVLTIKIVERAWVQVSLDGQDQPGAILEVGDELTWNAQDSIYFICGNAGGVEVTVNGQVLGVLGERAQVVEKTWTPQGETGPTPGPSTPTAAPTATPAGTPTPTPSG